MKTRLITLGGKGNTRLLQIGGDSPVSIQTMWKEPINTLLNENDKLTQIIDRINALEKLGCDVVRFAVPDMESAKALCLIAENTSMPLVADIHFDYKLALECLKGPVAGIRINPGNIGSRDKVEAVVNGCKKNNVAMRIGVNTGSLPQDLFTWVQENRITRAQALAETARREVAIFDELDFKNVVVSMKASSVKETVEANEAFAKVSDIPLHIGVTEAGPLIAGVVKSTLAFTTLLNEGIGSTIRVSLSSTPENEVIAGREILQECGKRTNGVKIVSCPRCGREGFDVHGFITRWEKELYSLKKDITVAVMGCVVNGPGEGKHADIGIAGSGLKAVIFKKGKIVQTISMEDADKIFRQELESL